MLRAILDCVDNKPKTMQLKPKEMSSNVYSVPVKMFC